MAPQDEVQLNWSLQHGNRNIWNCPNLSIVPVSLEQSGVLEVAVIAHALLGTSHPLVSFEGIITIMNVDRLKPRRLEKGRGWDHAQ